MKVTETNLGKIASDELRIQELEEIIKNLNKRIEVLENLIFENSDKN